MKYKLVTLVSFIFCVFFIFADDYSLDDTFGPVLEIGITRLKGNELYVTAENGRYELLLDNERVTKNKGEISVLKYNKGKIIYAGKNYNRVEVKKKDVFSLLSLSTNGSKYLRYRGEFLLKYRDNTILPINRVHAEEYIYSVVPSEIGYKFEDEAIKAQAIAARTYLYHSLLSKKYDYCDLLDTVNSQVYYGYDRENSRITELVNETSNLVMFYGGKAINALFHSTSGGKTANNEDVWPSGTPLPYIRSVEDKDNGNDSPRQNWNYTVSKSELSKKFGFKVSKITVTSRVDGRVKYVKITGAKTITITGNQLRSKVGYTKIFSTMLTIKDKGNSFYFEGHGSGHGLGMPQWSANGMAKKGKTYKEILEYYYTGISIERI